MPSCIEFTAVCCGTFGKQPKPRPAASRRQTSVVEDKRQSSRTNVTFISTRYSSIFPFLIDSFWALDPGDRSPCGGSSTAQTMPARIASSKLLVEEA